MMSAWPVSLEQAARGADSEMINARQAKLPRSTRAWRLQDCSRSRSRARL